MQNTSTRTTLSVVGMSCEHCKASVSRALLALAGVSAVEVSLERRQVAVEHDARRVDRARIAATIEEIGYEVVG